MKGRLLLLRVVAGRLWSIGPCCPKWKSSILRMISSRYPPRMAIPPSGAPSSSSALPSPCSPSSEWSYSSANALPALGTITGITGTSPPNLSISWRTRQDQAHRRSTTTTIRTANKCCIFHTIPTTKKRAADAYPRKPSIDHRFQGPGSVFLSSTSSRRPGSP